MAIRRTVNRVPSRMTVRCQRGCSVGVFLLVLAMVFVTPGLVNASDEDITLDTTASTYSSTAVHELSLTGLTVGNNNYRYLAIGVSLTADTDTVYTDMPTVSSATWTVGTTVQNLSFRTGQTSSTGGDDTARAEIWQLVAPTTGSGTLKIVLDDTTISDETVDSSPTGATSVSGESLGTGDGSTTTFSGTLSNTPVVRQTLTITAGSVTATDDGSGSLSGTGVSSGSINYDTGAWSITYDTAPADGTSITADYDYGKWKFSGTLNETPVEPGTVTFSATVGGVSKTATDDGSGNVSGDGGNITGTIVYSGTNAGNWTLEFMTPPDNSTSITATYDRQNQAQIVMGAISLYNVNQSDPSPATGGLNGTDVNTRASVDSDDRHVVFGNGATTGPATSMTKYYTGMTEQWKHQNGTGNTDTFGAGATRPTTGSLVSTTIRWTLGSARKWACAAIDIQPPQTPTEARFARAEALGTKAGTLLRWRTATEVRNLGFRVYREDDRGRRVRLNRSLVAGSALFAGPATRLSAGRSYVYWDRAARGGIHRYWLEAVDLDGSSQWYGPILAEPADPSVAKSLNLSTANKAETVSSPLVGRLGRSDAPSVRATGIRYSGTVRSVRGRLGAEYRQWRLAGGEAAKIVVDHDGWYSLSRAELAEAGYDPGPDPTGLKLFNRGREVPLWVSGTDDGRFDPQDRVEFFGVAVDTPSTGDNVYWLRHDFGIGRRISTIEASATGQPEALFPAAVERRDRSVYVAALTNNGDRDNFYGPVVADEPVPQTLYVDALPEDPATAGPATLEVALQGVTDADHVVSVWFNDRRLDDMELAGMEHSAAEYEIDGTWIREGNNTVTLKSAGGDSDVTVVDAVRLTWPRPYTAVNGELWMLAPAGSTVRATGFSGPDIRLYDVTDPFNPVELTGTVGEAADGSRFIEAGAACGEGTRTLLALEADRVSTPARIEANVPSSWHAASNGADMVIIAHDSLIQAAEKLAAYRTGRGLHTEVVPLSDIYDEFSWGLKDPEAIRSFLARAVTAWDTAPRYVLLLGDASFDPRNYLGFGDRDLVPTNIVPTNFLKTASDDLFADVDGDGLADMAVGRLPAASLDEAQVMVDKIIGYETEAAAGDWAETVTLVSDAVGANDYDFGAATDRFASLVPAQLSTERISLNDPDAARPAILQAFNEGRLLVSYEGHGSEAVWSSDAVFDSDDAAGLVNGDKLPLVIAMDCLNGLFHDLYQDSLAEALLRNPNGGAVAVWASSALTDPTGQDMLNRAAAGDLFTGAGMTLGEAVKSAKAEASDPDIRNTWILFGDPSMRLRR